MPNWEQVADEIFQDSKYLYDDKRYRSATSRFYYAAFAALTGELTRRNASADFTNGRPTPGHHQLPNLVDKYFQQFGSDRRRNLIRAIRNLYRNRIDADYGLLRIDRQSAKEAYRTATAIMRYLGVVK